MTQPSALKLCMLTEFEPKKQPILTETRILQRCRWRAVHWKRVRCVFLHESPWAHYLTNYVIGFIVQHSQPQSEHKLILTQDAVHLTHKRIPNLRWALGHAHSILWTPHQQTSRPTNVNAFHLTLKSSGRSVGWSKMAFLLVPACGLSNGRAASSLEE